MEIKTVTSRENPIIRAVFKLKNSAKERNNSSKCIVEGLRICTDCADNGVQFDTLIFTKKFENKNEKVLNSFLENSVNAIKVPDFVFEKIADTENPQGVLAVVNIPKNQNEIIKDGRYIALENLSDPTNLGAIARTAEALGVTGILISKNSCDPYSPKVIRASMGTILRMPIIILDDFIIDLVNSKLKLFACVVNGGKEIEKICFTDGSAVLIGNEANGLSKEIIEKSEKITIKMSGRAESLNASVAAAIAMWELIK